MMLSPKNVQIVKKIQNKNMLSTISTICYFVSIDRTLKLEVVETPRLFLFLGGFLAVFTLFKIRILLRLLPTAKTSTCTIQICSYIRIFHQQKLQSVSWALKPF